MARVLRNELTSTDKFQEAGFPCTVLDEQFLSRCSTFEADFDERTPALAIQANFIIGGLLLVSRDPTVEWIWRERARLSISFLKHAVGCVYRQRVMHWGHVPRGHYTLTC